jgi:transcriptional regulator with XRE-family HTH domain
MSELNTERPTLKAKRKEFTQADMIANDNLRSLWSEFRAKHFSETKESMTQEKAAKLMDWTQSNFSQYLNGIVPIGFKAAHRLSILFGCKISDIRPDYRDISLESDADHKEAMKSMLGEMLDLLSVMRSGNADADLVHQQVDNLAQRVSLTAINVEASSN